MKNLDKSYQPLRPLWSPSAERVSGSNVTKFISAVNKIHGTELESFQDLYKWSLTSTDKFWELIADFCQIKFDIPPTNSMNGSGEIFKTEFFPNSTLNFAENLLKNNSKNPAIIFRGETKRSEISWDELRSQVYTLATRLEKLGVVPGDRIAALMPNIPETVIAMLATTLIGATWSSCSPDFGFQGVLDRFGQIAPKILFVTDGYFFKGSKIDCTQKAIDILGSIPSIERCICVNFADLDFSLSSHKKIVSWETALSDTVETFEHQSFPFNHPLYIMYSSGTTGLPKCIVHGAGGTLVEHLKELIIHVDLKPTDNIFYYTTCGWMMWNFLVSALGVGSTITLYDGAPFYPNTNALLKMIDEERITHFGTSAKYLAAFEKATLPEQLPSNTLSLNSLKTILSTGSPLLPEQFDFVYGSIKKDLCLSSISGGTDIIGCFGLTDPIGPVYKGEIQSRSLGLAVNVFDDEGKPIPPNKGDTLGELVCTNAFPSMPIYFWNDEDRSKYDKAYFKRFDGVWHHGDYATITESGGLIITGRSDAVLNPGGVRIGTGEIYRIVENLPEIEESIVVGQEWDGDIRVVLFVVLKNGQVLNDEIKKRISTALRTQATPRHVPQKIIQVTEIPKTINGKLVELAVRNVIHKRPVTNIEALQNPNALDQFINLPELSF